MDELNNTVYWDSLDDYTSDELESMADAQECDAVDQEQEDV